jgi:dipeptide/tripeptide permease
VLYELNPQDMEVIQQMNYSAVIPEVQVSITASSQTSTCVTAHLESSVCALWFVQHDMYQPAAGNTAAFKAKPDVSNEKF